MVSSRRWIHKLNPLNHLTIKIFLWFWFANLLIALTATFLIHQFIAISDPIPVNPKQNHHLERVAEKVFPMVGRNDRKLIKRLSRLRAFVVKADGYIIGSLPNNSIKNTINEMIESEYPLQKIAKNHILIGPKKLTKEDSTAFLFAWKKETKRGPRFFSFRSPFDLWKITFAVFVSVILCLILTYYLVKPIKALRIATKQFSEGDFSARITTLSHRRDEFGLLGHDFNQMAQRIERLIEAQKKFLHHASHELRSPLTRMKVTMGIAEQSQNSWKKNVDRLNLEIENLESIIQKLLDFSRLENDLKSLDKQTFAVMDLFHQVCDEVRLECAEAPEFILDCPKDICINGDYKLWLIAIGNLVRNSVKFSQDKAIITLRAALSGDVTEITVKDRGVGVESSQLDTLFVPFVRGDSSIGYGLGLAIVKEIITAHGGQIEARSAHEKGLEIHITLKNSLMSGCYYHDGGAS